MARLVVGDRDVEGVEEFCELGGLVAGERGAEVGDRGEERFDLVRPRFVAAARFELPPVVVERGALASEFFDADLRGGDDGVVRVVVLFEAERLAADRLVEVGELPDGGGELGFAAVVAVGERVGEFVVEEAEPVGAEEAAAEEVEERFEDDLFADAEDARMPGGVGRGEAAPVDELAAVPVGALLMAAFHPPAAESAVDAAAERVEASVAVTRPLDVGLRGFEGRAPVVAQRALLDLVEELAVDDRFV